MRPVTPSVYEVEFNLREQPAFQRRFRPGEGRGGWGGLGALFNRLYPEVLPEKKTGRFTVEVNERVQNSFI